MAVAVSAGQRLGLGNRRTLDGRSLRLGLGLFQGAGFTDQTPLFFCSGWSFNGDLHSARVKGLWAWKIGPFRPVTESFQ